VIVDLPDLPSLFCTNKRFDARLASPQLALALPLPLRHLERAFPPPPLLFLVFTGEGKAVFLLPLLVGDNLDGDGCFHKDKG